VVPHKNAEVLLSYKDTGIPFFCTRENSSGGVVGFLNIFPPSKGVYGSDLRHLNARLRDPDDIIDNCIQYLSDNFSGHLTSRIRSQDKVENVRSLSVDYLEKDKEIESLKLEIDILNDKIKNLEEFNPSRLENLSNGELEQLQQTLERSLEYIKEEARKRKNCMCIICYDNKSSHAIVPCGHKQFCEACIGLLDKCPICNSPKQMSLKIFE